MDSRRQRQYDALAIVFAGCDEEQYEGVRRALGETDVATDKVWLRAVERAEMALRQWRAGWFDAAVIGGNAQPSEVERWVQSAYHRPVLAVWSLPPAPREARRFGAMGVELVTTPQPRHVAAALAVAIERATRRRRFAEQLAELEAANRDLRVFAQMVAHELRQPLHVALGFLDVLSVDLDDVLTADHCDTLAAAQGAIVRVGSVLDAVARTFEEPGDDAALPAIPVCVGDLLERVVARMRGELAAVSGEVTWDALPPVGGDPPMLEQLFENLIRNAIVHRGDEPPRIGVEAHRLGRAVEFVVHDNARGIPRHELNHIFEPKWRGRGAGDRGGSGLGLALCRRIVERHGGQIWVESTPGQGSCFHFVLPAVEA